MARIHWKTARQSVRGAIRQKRESKRLSSRNLDVSARLPLMPVRKNAGSENQTATNTTGQQDDMKRFE